MNPIPGVLAQAHNPQGAIGLPSAVPAASAPAAPSPVRLGSSASIVFVVEFWARQMSEHALFMSLGIVADGRLQDRAKAARADWEGFRAGKTHDPERALALAAQLRNLKEAVLSRLRAGEWLGWLYPSFVAHILDELDHFVRSLRTAMSPSTSPMNRPTETCAVLGFMRDHAAFAAQMLDPSEAKLIREARALQGGLAGLAGACRSSLPGLLALSSRAARDLDQYLVGSGIGTPRTKSIIHPVLVAHVVREGRMFIDTLKALEERR